MKAEKFQMKAHVVYFWQSIWQPPRPSDHAYNTTSRACPCSHPNMTQKSGYSWYWGQEVMSMPSWQCARIWGACPQSRGGRRRRGSSPVLEESINSYEPLQQALGRSYNQLEPWEVEAVGLHSYCATTFSNPYHPSPASAIGMTNRKLSELRDGMILNWRS